MLETLDASAERHGALLRGRALVTAGVWAV